MRASGLGRRRPVSGVLGALAILAGTLTGFTFSPSDAQVEIGYDPTYPWCTGMEGYYQSQGWTGAITLLGRTYQGEVEATHTFVGAYENGPGTYSDFDCTVPGAAGTVTGSTTLTDTTGPLTGTVTCTYTSGEYRRGPANRPFATPDPAQWTVHMWGTCTDGSRTDVANEWRVGQVYNCNGGPPTSCDSRDDSFLIEGWGAGGGGSAMKDGDYAYTPCGYAGGTNWIVRTCGGGGGGTTTTTAPSTTTTTAPPQDEPLPTAEYVCATPPDRDTTTGDDDGSYSPEECSESVTAAMPVDVSEYLAQKALYAADRQAAGDSASAMSVQVAQPGPCPPETGVCALEEKCIAILEPRYGGRACAHPQVAHEFENPNADYYLWDMQVSGQPRDGGKLYKMKVGTRVHAPDHALPKIVKWGPDADETILEEGRSTSYSFTYAVPQTGISFSASQTYPVKLGRIHPYIGPVGHIYHVSWNAADGKALLSGQHQSAKGSVVWKSADGSDPLPTLYVEFQNCSKAQRCTLRDES
jgi:hypothetical protein